MHRKIAEDAFKHEQKLDRYFTEITLNLKSLFCSLSIRRSEKTFKRLMTIYES